MNTFRTPNRKFVRESRPLDFLYDPVYTLPSKSNFYKSANMASRMGDSKMRLRSNFPAMFSDILTDRRIEACLRSNSPNFIDKFIPQYDISGTPVFPSGDGPPCPGIDDVSGAQRAKYFIRYVDPVETLRSYQVARATTSKRHSHEPTLEVPFKSRGTQTEMREMETQTDPYSPQYSLPNPDDYPKVLALIKMTWGKGLPATLDDIVTIERALTRRLLELSDRDPTGDLDFEKRVKLMEDLEAQKWKDREKDLEKVKNLKMDIVTKELQDVKSKMSQDQTQRLEKLFDARKRDNGKKLQAIKNQYLRQLRKLERKHRVGKKVFKRDIILDYIDMESAIYAPLLRNGPNIDQLSFAPDYQFTVHKDFETLVYLTDMESFANEHINFDRNRFSKDVMKIKPNRATRIAEKQLKDCYETFSDVCKPKAKALEDEMLNSMIMKSVRRLSTPENTVNCMEDDDEEEEAAILLQTLIRGRAVQSILRQEAENSMETILQVKAMYETDPYGALQPLAEKVALRRQQREQDTALNKDNERKELTAQVEGEILAHMMGFLEKEMTRLLDERKIHALILLAERERRMLEASEAGKRQKEEDCQRTNDEIWRQVVGVHQQTVDMYLEDIYLESINRSSDEGGRKYVQDLARTVNEAAYAMEQNIKDCDKDEIAADLVQSFLFPQVQRENIQRQVADLHGRYYTVATQVSNAVLNSQGVVHDVLSTIDSELKKRLNIGMEVVDASYCSVNQIIHEAVGRVIEKEFGPNAQAKEKEQKEEIKEEERVTTGAGITVEPGLRKSLRRSITFVGSSQGGNSTEQTRKSTESEGKQKESTTLNDKTLQIPILKKTESEGGGGKVTSSVEEKVLKEPIVSSTTSTMTMAQGQDGIPPHAGSHDEGEGLSDESHNVKDLSDYEMIPIEVPVGLSDLIGLKTMEIEAVTQVGVEMAEMGETAVKVFDAACRTVQDVMDDVEKYLIPSDDESDVELDEQDVED